MLGRKSGDTEDGVYLTDLEPRTAAWGGNQGELMAKVFDLLANIESIESRAKGGTLARSRSVLRDLFGKLTEPLPDDRYLGEPLLDHYRDIRTRLGGS